MNNQDLKKLAEKYKEMLIKNNSTPIMNKEANDEYEHLDHIHWMCDQVITSQDWPVDKINRWIGFIQCGLWGAGIVSIDEMRNQIINMKG